VRLRRVISSLAAVVLGSGLFLGAEIGPANVASAKSAKTVPESGENPVINNVVITGTAGDYTLTVQGSGFGSSPVVSSSSGYSSVTTPYLGDVNNFRIGDNAELGHGEWGFESTGGFDANVLLYESWSDTQIVVSNFGGAPGDALIVAVWNSVSMNGAVWGGNDPSSSSSPHISSVTISGTGEQIQILVQGTGFGSAPAGLPYTGDLNDFFFWDARSHCGAGSSLYSSGGSYFGDRNPDSVPLSYTEWTNTEIEITELAGSYDVPCGVNEPGDPVAVAVWNSSATSDTGPQTAWGGFLPNLFEPRYHSPAIFLATTHQSFSFAVLASGNPAPNIADTATRITEKGKLPAGILFKADGNGMAILHGTPSTRSTRTYKITFDATNFAGSVLQEFRLTVDGSQRSGRIERTVDRTGH